MKIEKPSLLNVCVLKINLLKCADFTPNVCRLKISLPDKSVECMYTKN